MAEKDKSFEEELEALENIVKALEDGEFTLEESLKKFEEGIAIYRRCNEKLKNAVQRVEKLSEKDGEITKEEI